MNGRAALTGLLLLLVSAPILSGSEARAAAAKKAAPTTAAGKAELAEGRKAFDAGRYQEAVAPLEKAYELSQAPAILYTLGQCYRQLGDWEKAAFYFGRYLALSPRPVADEEAARALLSEMQLKADVEKKQKPQIEVAQPKPPVEPAVVPATALPTKPEPVPTAVDGDRGGIATRWWFWTAIGGVVVAGAVTAAVLATQGGKPSTTLGEMQWPKP